MTGDEPPARRWRRSRWSGTAPVAVARLSGELDLSNAAAVEDQVTSGLGGDHRASRSTWPG